MSDAGRKNFSDKIDEHLKPDSEKTTGERFNESVTNAADQVAAAITPESQKSATQQAGDDFKEAKDDLKDASGSAKKSFTETMSETAKSVMDSATEYAHEAADYIRGTGKSGNSSA